MLQDASRPAIVEELIAALAPHPKGLRRWSVMRAIRKSREAVSRDIPLKLEADVERTFRRFCRGDEMRASDATLFYRPAEKAGEVWALDADMPVPVKLGAWTNNGAQTSELFAGPPAARAGTGRQGQGKGRAPRRGNSPAQGRTSQAGR